MNKENNSSPLSKGAQDPKSPRAMNRPQTAQSGAPKRPAASNAQAPIQRQAGRPTSSARYTPMPPPEQVSKRPINMPNGAQKNSAPLLKKACPNVDVNQRRIFKKKSKNTVEEPQRRRNDESYVFSRSLSETHERIMAER